MRSILCVVIRSVEFLYVEFKYSLQQDNGRHIADGETVRGSQVSFCLFCKMIRWPMARFVNEVVMGPWRREPPMLP